VQNPTNVKRVDSKQEDSKRTVNKIAATAKLPADSIRKAVELKKTAPEVADLVRSGEVTFKRNIVELADNFPLFR
jgi:hypothetical protein